MEGLTTGAMIQDLRVAMREEGHRILDYWRAHVVLPEGGFHGQIDSDGTVHEDADRGVILAARILWTYSRAVTSGFADTPENRKIAQGAFEFLRDHFWDPLYLGFYWLIDINDRPTMDHKHIYAQAFALYGLAEYTAMSASTEALKLAQLTYTLIERHAADKNQGGYFETFSRDWKLQDAKDIVNHGGPKSMNTHLHLLEAYTRLYQVWPSPELRGRLSALLELMRSRIVDAKTSHFNLFFDMDWRVVSDEVSYGHDIEGSWLMLEAADILADADEIAKCQLLARQMVDATLAEGVDDDHGVQNEGRGVDVIDGDKHWWPQAEGVVGCVNAYQVTGDEKYLRAAVDIWSFIEAKILDRAHGEWLWRVSRDGAPYPTDAKVDAWKCPYHNTRACMEIEHRLSS